MLALKLFGKCLLFGVVLCSCQAVSPRGSSGQEAVLSRSVSYLSPQLPENQLSDRSAYNGQVILTVEADEVIRELSEIEEVSEAIAEIVFLSTNSTFNTVSYVVHFKKNINPIPYYNFFLEYEGVVAAEFDGIIGLAEVSD